jgi:hypothetical protein
MKKIPTLFVRDPANRKHVLPEVTPGCEWVLAGEGVATRKYDGTCTLLDEEGRWWARREVKPGKGIPDDFVPVEHDLVTGKTVGWEPIESSGFAKFHADALPEGTPSGEVFRPGTYELCGPKVNGNPEGFPYHLLIEHSTAQVIPLAYPLDFEGLRHRLTSDWPHEGIVWHHPDGRMAKLKKRDFE